MPLHNSAVERQAGADCGNSKLRSMVQTGGCMWRRELIGAERRHNTWQQDQLQYQEEDAHRDWSERSETAQGVDSCDGKHSACCSVDYEEAQLSLSGTILCVPMRKALAAYSVFVTRGLGVLMLCYENLRPKTASLPLPITESLSRNLFVPHCYGTFSLISYLTIANLTGKLLTRITITRFSSPRHISRYPRWRRQPSNFPLHKWQMDR